MMVPLPVQAFCRTGRQIMHERDFLIRYDVEADNAKGNGCQTVPKEKTQVKDHKLPVVVFENLSACTGCLPNAGIRCQSGRYTRRRSGESLQMPKQRQHKRQRCRSQKQKESTAAYITGGAEGKQRNQADQCNGAYDNQPAQRTNADAQAQLQRSQIGFSAGKRLEKSNRLLNFHRVRVRHSNAWRQR